MHSAAKVLKFPLSGIARDIDYRKAYIPEEEITFTTPFAVNVRGSDTFHRRNRGGSRPGFKEISEISASGIGRWLWPDGEPIKWEDGANMVFKERSQYVSAPDGSMIVDPHARVRVQTLGVVTDIATLYRGRVVCASGSIWYASGIGDPSDWDFGKDSEDPSRAMSGNVALATVRGEPITALMAVRDAALFVTTAHSVWMMQGEVTGGMRCVSEYVGCVSKDAWCFDGSAIWFVSNQGLYRMGIGEPPVKASARIPEEFRGVDSAVMVYDPDDEGIHIFTQTGSGLTTVRGSWMYDIGNKAFWKDEYAGGIVPVCGYHMMKDGVGVNVFLCSDGKWRYFDDEADDDCGAAFSSRVAIGPIRCGQRDDMDGMVAEIEATLAESSSDVRVSAFTAHSPEAAVYAAENAQGTPFTASAKSGWNNVCRPRQRGAWAVFVLSSNGRWGYESMTAVFKQLGRLR